MSRTKPTTVITGRTKPTTVIDTVRDKSICITWDDAIFTWDSTDLTWDETCTDPVSTIITSTRTGLYVQDLTGTNVVDLSGELVLGISGNPVNKLNTIWN